MAYKTINSYFCITMEITQEKIDFAIIKVENHLNDLGIKNNFSLLRIEQGEEKM